MPYDLFVAEPSLMTSQDDQQLTDLLVRYHDTLLPSPSDLQTMTHLVNRVVTVIENLIVNPAEFTAGQIEEVKCVGSFKLGTWLSKHNTADLVVVLRTLPTAEALKGLQIILKKRLDADAKSPKDQCVVSTHAYGFSVSADEFSVRAFLTTSPIHLNKADPTVHGQFLSRQVNNVLSSLGWRTISAVFCDKPHNLFGNFSSVAFCVVDSSVVTGA
ncbi:unnamed protein product [Echinostoma caproni]|uniref:DZF domain-containing protein n=1 Tax=Echinostoma caproni TaxID=27848 RepID=A0A183B8C2_9TREM|nr:unnamed protein product [Echinostoma caproni]